MAFWRCETTCRWQISAVPDEVFMVFACENSWIGGSLIPDFPKIGKKTRFYSQLTCSKLLFYVIIKVCYL